LRVLQLVDEPYDSGIVSYALAAAAALKARGHYAPVAGLAGKAPLEKASHLGLQTLGFSQPWLAWLSLRAFLRRKEIGLLVAHTGSAHTLAAAAAWGTPARVVRVRGDARPMRARPLSSLLWRRTAGFIAASQAILAQAEPFLGGLPRAAILQGLPDPGPVPPLPEGPPHIGIVARLDPVKGHRIFILAAARVLRRFPEARFLVAGREENVSLRELRQLAQEEGVKDALLLFGHARNAGEIMERCHVGVVSSLGSEAVSRSAVEWLSRGRPLVASSVGCLPEYLAGSEGGRLVAPGEPGALAEALCSLLESPERLKTAAAAARRRYEERFTFERFADEVERFCRSVHP